MTTRRPVLTCLSLVASTPVDGEQGWRAEAACQYTDPEAFFPDLGVVAPGRKCAPAAPSFSSAASGRSPPTNRTVSGVVTCPANGSRCATPCAPGRRRAGWSVLPPEVWRWMFSGPILTSTPWRRHEPHPAPGHCHLHCRAAD